MDRPSELETNTCALDEETHNSIKNIVALKENEHNKHSEISSDIKINPIIDEIKEIYIFNDELKQHHDNHTELQASTKINCEFETYDENDIEKVHDENDIEKVHDENDIEKVHDENDIEKVHDENDIEKFHDENDIEKVHDENDIEKVHDENDVEKAHDENDVEKAHDENDTRLEVSDENNIGLEVSDEKHIEDTAYDENDTGLKVSDEKLIEDTAYDENDTGLKVSDKKQIEDTVYDENDTGLKVSDEKHIEDTSYDENDTGLKVSDEKHIEDTAYDENDTGLKVSDEKHIEDTVYDENNIDGIAYDENHIKDTVYEENHDAFSSSYENHDAFSSSYENHDELSSSYENQYAQDNSENEQPNNNEMADYNPYDENQHNKADYCNADEALESNGDVDGEYKTCGQCNQTFPSYLELFRHSCETQNFKKRKTYNKTIRTCKHCKAEFKSLTMFRKHVLECWRKRAPKREKKPKPKVNLQDEELDISLVKIEPVDSDDTIIPDEPNNDMADLYHNEQDEMETSFGQTENLVVKQEVMDTDYEIPGIKLSIVKSKPTCNGIILKKAPSQIKPKKKKPPISHCLTCGVKFKDMKHYTVHQKRKIPCRPPPYICGGCGRKFLTEYNLMYHERKGSCARIVNRMQKKAEAEVEKMNKPTKKLDMNLSGISQEDINQSTNQLEVNKDNEIIECELCDAKFLFPHLKKRHYERSHKQIKVAESQVLKSVKRKTSAVVPVSKKKKEYKSVEIVQSSHSDASSGESNKEIGTEEQDVDATENKEDEIDVSIYLTPNGYQCPMCDHFFPFQYRLKDHLMRKVPCRLNHIPSPCIIEKEPIIPPPKIIISTVQRPYQSENIKKLRKKKLMAKVGSKTLGEPKNVVVKKRNASNLGLKRKLKNTSPTKTKPNFSIPAKKLKMTANSKALCKICNTVFASVPDCYDHCLQYHNGLNEPMTTKLITCEPEEKMPEKKVSELIDTMSECPICLKRFVLIRARNAHLRAAHRAVEEEKVNQFLRDTFCKKCKTSFATTTEKIKHGVEIHGEFDMNTKPVITSFKPTKNNCQYCNIDFPSKIHLNTHMLRCTVKKIKISPRSLKLNEVANNEPNISPGILARDQYFCEHCEIKFTSLTLYKAHINRFCPKKDLMKNVKTKDFKQELFGLDDKVSLRCDMCKGQFNKRLEYDIHIKELCPSRPTSSKPSFGSPRLLPKLSKNKAATEDPKLKIELKVVDSANTILKPRHYCNRCDQSFPSHPHYASHRRRCKGLKSNVIENTPTVPTVPITTSLIKRKYNKLNKMNKKPGPIIKSASQKYNPKRSVSCTVCSKIFSEVFSLHRHMRMKHLPRQENCFPCLFCQQSYSRTSNLSKHYRDAHPESLKFQCGKCGKRYATNARCLQHIRKNHGLLNEEIKVKDLDEELFVETANSVPEVIQPQLELTPLKESPKETTKSKISAEEDGNFYTILDDTPGRGLYCCDVCNVSTFTKINALRRHWKTKPHKENAEKHKAQLNLKKPVKPKSPKDNGNLTQKLTCSVCLKVFFNTVGFVQHRLTHFNREQIDLAEINILNPYECEICHKVFTHHQRVQTHLLCHMKTIKTVHPASKQVLIQLPEAAERQRPGFPTVVEKPIESYIISAKKSISGGTPFKPVSPLDQTLYTCALCSSTFGTKYLYGAHVRHSCPKQVHCQYCSLSFTNLKNLRQHLHKCNHKKNLACKYCFLKFQSLNDLGWHEKGCVKFYEPEAIRDSDCAMSGPNDNHKLHCVTCGQDIPNFEGDYLQGHLIIHPKEPIKITCLTCNMFFNDKTDIYDHTNELSHLSSYVERCPVPLVVPNTWNSVVHRDKMVTSSPVGNMILDSNKTTACQSDNSESYFSKCSVSNTISKSDTKYSIWNNDDTKRLRSNFSQLMYLLISDPEVLASFGWGSRAIDGVLKDILVHLGQEPFVCNNDTREIDNLRSNIKLFMSICIKDDVMQAEQNETVDGLVARMLTLCSERD